MTIGEVLSCIYFISSCQSLPFIRTAMRFRGNDDVRGLWAQFGEQINEFLLLSCRFIPNYPIHIIGITQNYS